MQNMAANSKTSKPLYQIVDVKGKKVRGENPTLFGPTQYFEKTRLCSSTSTVVFHVKLPVDDNQEETEWNISFHEFKKKTMMRNLIKGLAEVKERNINI